jgi:RNA-directed DNA polymerase
MIDYRRGAISHVKSGEGGTGARLIEEQQSYRAKDEPCVLAINLMEKVCLRANLNQAYKRVKANKGAAGVDGLTIDKLGEYIRNHKEKLVESLLEGSYKPQPVRKVMIPKPDGGERQLGIPTVVDRLVQQAILQVIEPMFDAGFSESSYGFRPKRSAHDALKQASKYVEDGYVWVVDMDLEKFFDRVNHDILMSRLARRIGDKKLLKLIRAYLNAGIMQDGVVMTRHEGTPQGGPLSPLLSNVLLDELDKELERRGHKFCRYADDQNIYVRSERAGKRVFESVKKFLETRLKLKVNEKKSAVAKVSERKFLGYRIQTDGKLTIAPEALNRAKDKIKVITRRNRGVSFEQVIKELNQFLIGWQNYFKLSKWLGIIRDLDAWIRRKLRCYKLKQKKRCYSIVKYLINLGIPARDAWSIGKSSKGWWRVSHCPPVDRALSNEWFATEGLISLHERQTKLLAA